MNEIPAANRHVHFVRGYDGQMDRGTRAFEVTEPVDAAGDYLQSYVEDWRGGWVDKLTLLLRVWRDGNAEASALPFTGIAIFTRGSDDVMYLIERDTKDA